MADILAIDNLGAGFAIDGGLGALPPGGGIPDDGAYHVTITEIGLIRKEGKPPTMTVTMTGAGDGDRYDYVTLPVDPSHKHHKTYQRAFNQFMLTMGMLTEENVKAGYSVTPDYLKSLIGRSGWIYYIGPTFAPDGSINKNSEEITYLTAADHARVTSGELTITRRRKASTTPGGVPGVPAAPGAPAVPSAPAGPPTPAAPAASGPPAPPAPTAPTAPSGPPAPPAPPTPPA